MRKLLPIVVAVAAVLCLWKSRPLSMAQEQVPAPPAFKGTLPQGSGYVGVASCASPACHGGPLPAQRDRAWNSSYTVWVGKDKHARAYSALYRQQSIQILRNLSRRDDKSQPRPYEDARCLACHATASRVPEDDRALLTDGVGCETCHGPARGWLAEHTSRDWNRQRRDPHQTSADPDGRMVDTRSLSVRASVCVDCHIGSGGGNGLPLRNVDHDMIAAGHPRLTFEFATYLANVPRHWADRADGDDDKDPVRIWAVGQVVATQAALRLAASRAATAEKAHSPNWPELSEFNCYACHHGLSPKPQAAPGATKLGHIAWGTWNVPMTRLLLNDGLNRPDAAAGIQEISDLLANPTASPGAIRQKASAAADRLQPMVELARQMPNEHQAVARLLRAAKDFKPTNWDQACGLYLLLRTAHGSDRRFDGVLLELRKLLQFKEDKASKSSAIIFYDSPRDFHPAEFDNRMNDFRKLLSP